MPIAVAPVQLSQPLQTAPIVSGDGNSSGRPSSTRNSGGASGVSPAVEKEIPLAETVTLSATKASSGIAYTPAAPYAEIWKDGRKVASVDSRGNVSAYGDFVAPSLGGGSGISQAAQRAIQIARAVGGEIRVAGIVTDAATLTTGALLRETYGS